MRKIKKLLICLIAVLAIIIFAFKGYNVIAKSTNEMIYNTDGLPKEFPYVRYSDLINEKDILCSGRGIHLPRDKETIVKSGNKSKEEPYLTMNDIGKKIFKGQKTVTNDSNSKKFKNPYTSTTSRTLGHYVESEKKVATPQEAYVLSEVSQNLNNLDTTFYTMTTKEYTGNIEESYFYNIYGTVIYGVDVDKNSGEPKNYVMYDETTGKYYYVEIKENEKFFPYTYIQYAWWRTPAGGSANKVEPTPYDKEAEAFDAYINKIAKRDEKGNIVKEEKTVEINGKETKVTAPVLDYKVSGDDSKAEVQYDEDNEKYLIGPFKLNYYEESVTTERGTVNFAFIQDARLISNLGELDKSKWSFKFNNRDSKDKAELPHSGEEFYIIVDYVEEMRFIEDLKFDFKYMNAGGTYTLLKGESFEATWEPESKAIWCNEKPSKTKKCSHGFDHKHIIKWEYWLELKSLTPHPSQPLAQVYKAARWYEDVSYSFKAKLPELPPDTPEPPEEYIKLTIPIEGEVWIDQEPDKKNADLVNGKRDASEKGYKNVEVYVYKTLKDKSGKIVERKLAKIYDKDNKNELKFPIYTDENGKYTIPNINVPGTGKVSYMKENGYDVSYDVEFKYNGQKYETVSPLVSAKGNAKEYIEASKTTKKVYENDSLATENLEDRENYNNKFAKIYGGNSIDKDGNTVGYASDGKNEIKLNYNSTEFSLPNNENTRRLSTLAETDKDGNLQDQYKMSATTGNIGLYFPVDNKISCEDADDVIELSVEKNENGKTTTYKTIYDYMLHINMGVKERDEADLSVFKDLYKAEILVNEKEITKTYNKYVDVELDENKEALKTQIEACRIGKYNLGLYSSDYEYRSTVYNTSADVVKNIKADTELKVYLTYRIAVNNESQVSADNSLNATINQINDYYDKSFTLINEEVKANVLNDGQERNEKIIAESPYYRIVKANEIAEYTYWSDNMKKFNCNNSDKLINDSYKQLTITDFDNQKLAPGEQLELFITFEVDKDGYKKGQDRKNLLGEKNNIAEIANYSTYYSNGKVAGIIDRDSAPGNIDLNRNVKSWYEDDTESAPATDIELYRYNREINGTVWEDSETNELKYGQKVGNGIMEENENKVKDIDVQLVEKITIDGIEYEKIWSEDDFTDLTDAEKQNYRLKDVTTDENGFYNFKGVLAGNYVVRFKYGNKEENVKYNGQDYKNTAYQTEMKNEDGTTTLNNEWQDIHTSSDINKVRVSDARDYELQRMKVIAYSKTIDNQLGNILESADQEGNHNTLIKNTQMVANTAKMNIEIEHQDYIRDGSANIVNGLEEYTYTIKDIDFGLEKRSETAINLDKKISKITLYKNDGTTPLLNVIYNEDGTINKENADSINLSKVVHVDTANNRQGFEYIQFESNMKNGTLLKIEYNIKITNNSEVDWTGKIYELDSESIINEVEELEKTEPYVSGKMINYGEYVGLNYYNNKNNEDDKIVKTKVEQIIDYVDNDASPDLEDNSLIENSSWKQVTLEELINDNMVDPNVFVEENGEKILIDSKKRPYFSEVRSNVIVNEDDSYNSSLIADLVPVTVENETKNKATGEIRVVVSKQLSEENSENDIYDNIAEILKYSNTVGRRDEQAVPGNAQVNKGEYIAATGYEYGNLVEDYNGAKEVLVNNVTLHLNGERDSDAPSFITLSEPLGITTRDYNQKSYMLAIVVSGIIMCIGIVIIKKIIK